MNVFGISPSRVHYILKNILNFRKVSARWVPHLLTDGQTKQRDKIAKQMLKILLNFDEKKFANVVTGSKTVRKVGNKICAIIFYHFFRIFNLDIFF